MIKRIAALFLVVLLLIGMIPSAFAEEIPGNNISESESASEQTLSDDSEDEYGVMALASTQSSIMLFDYADNGNYTTVLNSQVTCAYKPNGTGTTRTAYIKNLGWHFARYGGVAYLKRFAQEAKRYGVVYCALRGKEKSADGMVDVMVRAEDASKINRIVERFKLATVDTASIKHDIEKTRQEKESAPAAPEKAAPEKDDADLLLDELLGAPIQKEQPSPENPTAAKTEKSPPSEPTSGMQRKTAEGTAKAERPSVREELREIKAARQEKAAPPKVQDITTPVKQPEIQPHIHPGKKKPKQKVR